MHGKGGLNKSQGPVASGTDSGSFSLGELPNLLYIVEEKRENFLFVIDESVSLILLLGTSGWLGTLYCCFRFYTQLPSKSVQLFPVLLSMLPPLQFVPIPLFKTQLESPLTLCFLLFWTSLYCNTDTWYSLNANYTTGAINVWAKFYCYLHATDTIWDFS